MDYGSTYFLGTTFNSLTGRGNKTAEVAIFKNRKNYFATAAMRQIISNSRNIFLWKMDYGYTSIQDLLHLKSFICSFEHHFIHLSFSSSNFYNIALHNWRFNWKFKFELGCDLSNSNTVKRSQGFHPLLLLNIAFCRGCRWIRMVIVNFCRRVTEKLVLGNG